jgi:hypothetical protein
MLPLEQISEKIEDGDVHLRRLGKHGQGVVEHVNHGLAVGDDSHHVVALKRLADKLRELLQHGAFGARLDAQARDMSKKVSTGAIARPSVTRTKPALARCLTNEGQSITTSKSAENGGLARVLLDRYVKRFHKYRTLVSLVLCFNRLRKIPYVWTDLTI